MKISITQAEKVPVKSGGAGLFLEDINYGLDGGLNAELLENGSFEAKNVRGSLDGFTAEEDGGYGWEAYPAGAEAALKVKTDRALFPENPHYMRLTAQAGAGMKNKAYDGIYLKAKTEYRISFYARSYDYKGGIFVGVFLGGAPLVGKKIKIKADGKWRRYSFRVKSKQNAERADFCVTLCKAGALHFDCFSMTPEDAILGVFRRDLVQLLKEMEPAFLRFPSFKAAGENRCLWKYSIGQTERRKHLPNAWGTCGEGYSHYTQTFGIGYYEYFRLAEYLGAKSIPVVNLGDGSFEEAENDIQDALDIVEFACGGTDTVWGRVRAEMGHPAPFSLEYLAVEGGQHKDNAFELFSARIHEKYPQLNIVKTEENQFVSPQQLYENVNVYDGYPRENPVVGGGFAAHVEGAGCGLPNSPQANCWEGALAEAAYLTGVERNSDVVLGKSYAPIFARYGFTQWSPALIWFDGKSVCPTANYYVQKLYSLYTGGFALKAKSDEEKVYVSATERDAFTFVKVVNAGDGELQAEVDGDYDFGALTQILLLTGGLEDYNTIEEPEKIVPVIIAPAGERTLSLPPRSFQVLVFKK